MVALPPPLVTLTALSAVMSAGVAGHAWKHKRKPGAKMFAAVVAGAAIWSLSYAIALNTFDPQLRQALELPAWIGRIIMPGSWIVFALQYTGRDSVLTKPVLVGLTLNPLATVIVILTHGSHQWMWRGYHIVEVWGAATAGYESGIWLVWQTVYGYILIGAGLLILVEMLVSQGRLYRGQAMALIIAAGIPTVTNVAWLFKAGPVPTLDFTPIAFSMTCFMMAYALFRQDLFSLVPATRRVGQRAAIDYFSAGVVVIDDESRVIDVNTQAETIFGVRSSMVLGSPIDTLVAEDIVAAPGESQLLDIDGLKFELTATPIPDQYGGVIGKTLMFHDVTERVRRKQLLSVLNRVLRHNLRNDLNLVQGYAQTIREHANNSEAELATQIEYRSTKLMELGNKAREIERLIGEEFTMTRCDVSRRTSEIADRLGETYLGADIRVEAPHELWVETDERVVATVLDNLIENAIEHNDTSKPVVDVTVSRSETSVTIVVADNGPGVPAQELSVLEADRETPLEHGSGLGLWLVRWSVTALNGDIAFEKNEPRGTVVRIRLPDASDERRVTRPVLL